MNKPLRILFISRATLFTVKGGDSVQMLKTAEGLRNLGVETDIRLCNEKVINYGEYNLIHFFNIIRPADIIYHIKKSKLPYVISPIYVDYSAYEKTNKSIKGILLNLFKSDTREYLKAIGRMVFNGETILSNEYFYWGHKKSIRYVIENAALLLPNSENENRRLLNAYGVATEYTVIPNAADTSLFNYTIADIEKKDQTMVLCVARIEGRKNQLNLIHALNNTAFELTIIGNPAPNHIAYYNACVKAAGPNIHFIPELPQEQLLKYYKKAKVHVLPSWFETTGLSSLEALFCGCTIVVTKFGDTGDYFDSGDTFFCDPGSPVSIKNEITKASGHIINTKNIDEAMNKYNWQKTAEKTLDAYKKTVQNA